MIRNLIIGCDGTWNEPEQFEDGTLVPSNVTKLLNALIRSPQQRQHYEPGVGTKPWELLPGGIYGYGLDERIRGAYRFLFNRYQDAAYAPHDNRIFLFGFSRGAYTARRIAGLLAHSGIPKAKKDLQLGWEMYVENDRASAARLKQQGRFVAAPVEMVGVWDTVKATNDRSYNDLVLASNVARGYHALAIDEKRASFKPLRWTPDPRVLEVWFAGVHSDVGGGYKAAGLSDLALEWMFHRALTHGLRIRKASADALRPNPTGRAHRSYKGIWVPLGTHVRTVEARDYVHVSIKQRLASQAGYQPEGNLPAAPRYWSPA